ncbi:uncharacterized protein [Diabrotica undecimpunctata]|uniref:uncharacterized protein n=1 Tax=Diabrotica undecimpunctata TaxID=50387 RepID=UPI003B6381A6
MATRNQIDFILISSRLKFSNTNAKTFPGAECGSDNQLLMADYRTRFKNIRKASPRSFRLTDPELATFKERIEPALTRIENNQAEQSVDEAWTDIKETIVTTVNQCRQPSINNSIKPWISRNTWKVIEQRKQLKVGPCNQQTYKALSRDIQRRCRKDKQEYISEICHEIENHGYRNETKDLFRKVKILAREFKPKNYAIEDKHDSEQSTQDLPSDPRDAMKESGQDEGYSRFYGKNKTPWL